jgi:rhodanese-related sulfurtransferase
MKQVDAYSLSQILASGQMIALFDLRAPVVVENESILGAQTLGLESLQQNHFPDLPKDTPIYLVCERGAVSELAGLYLETAGFTEVYNLAGGMIEWQKVRREEEGRRRE